MANDPILDAITGGGVAVADEDPILSAIRTSGSPKLKAAPATSNAPDPIMAAIAGQDSGLRTPSLDELATGTSPETQTPSLTDHASKLGRSMIPLTPPSVNMQSPYWQEEYAARQRDVEKINQIHQAQQEKAEQEQERQAEIANQPFEGRLAQSMTEPGTVLGTVLSQQTAKQPAPQFESDYFKHRAAEAATQGKSVWDAFPHSVTEALIRSVPANRNMPTEQARRIAEPLTQPLLDVPTAAGNADQPFIAGAERAAGGFTSPENLALLGSLGSLETAAQSGAGLVRHAPRIISGLFATQMGTGLVESARDYQKAKAAGDVETAQRILGSAAVQVPLTLLTAYHAGAGRGGAPIRPDDLLETVHAADTAARMSGSVVGAGEQLHPETPETLQAQTNALANGTNRAVYFPKGQQNIPEAPEGANVTVVKGNKPGAGTWFHDDSISPEQVHAAVNDGTYHQLLGFTQPKEEAVANGRPTTVVARDENGTELKAGLVDATDPQAIAAQAAEFARQFPDGKIGVETPQDVIASRQGSPTKAETSPSQMPLSEETQREQAVSAHVPTVERRFAASPGVPPEGVTERRTLSLAGTQGPPEEQIRLLSEYRRQLAQATTEHERETLRAQIADLQGTEGALKIGGGGEELGEQIRQARAAKSGQPMSMEDALVNETARKAKNAPTPESLNFRQTRIPRTAPGAKQSPLAQRFSPEVLDEARQELTAAHQLASSFEQPGRYFASIGQTEQMIPQRSQSSAKGVHAGGTWYGVSSSRHIVADQFPWYADIEQGSTRLGKLIEKGKGAEYERLLAKVAESVQREKESAAPVIAEFAPRLRELSDKIDGHDLDLSDSLAQLANGDGRGFKNLREYIEGKITDAEQAHKFYRLVDAAAAEARQTSAPESSQPRSELRPGEGGRATAGAEASATARAESSERPSLSETSEAPNTEATQDLDQNALPGFESAIAEQKRGAARVRGERLSEEATRPLGNIERAAGEMERTSPLFRHTAANPQSDLFNSKVSMPEVGDRIQPTSGSLKGQTLEVTKIGDTGVYVREGDGPIKFVKNGEFSISDLASGRTSFANPIGLAGEGARLLSRIWEKSVARPLIDRVLKLGDKYRAAREADPAVAEGLHLLDNAPTYLRAKADQVVKGVIGNLSRAQERLFTLMADADSRENLRLNHPDEYAQAQSDPAVQEALRKYRPVEQELTRLRERMGGQTLEQDYLRRVYDKYVSGVNRAQAPGASERGTSAFDRVIRPQRTDKLSREATAEYHFENGLHEFGPAFATKFIATHLKALRDQVAREFMSKATMLPTGASEPRFIDYNGERYYRPDVAKDMRDAGQKNVKVYDRYDPTTGEKFPVPADGKYLGPRELVKTLTDFGRREESEPGALRRFFQEQILGFGFGVPHVFNIMRRVSQSAPLGAANPLGWARAWKVVLSKELRSRGISGLDDPTFDMLAKHGAISTGEVSNLRAYVGGNMNPANWARSLAQVGHKFLFEPTAAKGFGGLDQRARLYIADLIKTQRPDLSDADIAKAVRTQLGDYNRANWTDQQKLLAKFMMFPGWDTSSIRWVLQHPIKTTVPPALMVLLANRTLNYFGQNRAEDRDDISSIHIGDRAYSTSLLRESVARNLFRPVLNFAQSKLRGESNQRALDAASQGITAGAGGLLGMLRPDLSGFLALATNRENLVGSKEIVSKQDYDTPGKILPSRALEKQAAFTLRRAVPALDRMLDSDQSVDVKSFIGGNLGTPNYRDDAEKRLQRNTAEANRVYQSISKLAKTDPKQAREMLKDPDNAAYALFHHDLGQMTTALHKIDQVRATVEAAKISDTEKQSRLQALDKAKAMFLTHADALNNLLFERRTKLRQSKAAAPSIPMTPPTAGIPFRPPMQ